MDDASLLVFDVVGPMAHFRKFYSNTSSLTYSLPPRSTVAGLLAGMLGRERNGYHDLFALEKARVGVSLRSPVRRVVQTVGYLATDSDDWHGARLRTQVPVEFLLPCPPNRTIRYRIYFSHADRAVVAELYRLLASRRFCYPPCLGLACCPAWVEAPRLFAWTDLEVASGPRGPIPVGSAVPAAQIDPAFGLPLAPGVRVMKDRMPLALGPRRELVAIGDVVWAEPAGPAREGAGWRVAMRGSAYRLPEDDAWFVFLE